MPRRRSIPRALALSALAVAATSCAVGDRPTLAEDPPPGFYVPDGTIRVGAFTWEQVERPAISVPALPEG